MLFLQTVGPTLLTKTPMLLVWLAGIVLSVIMVRRGGGKAEKLLLAGCAINFVEHISTSFMSAVAAYMMSQHSFTPGITYQIFVWFLAVFGLVGFVCLILAFWIKFRGSLRR